MKYLVLCIFLTSCCQMKFDNPIFVSIYAYHLEAKINEVLTNPECQLSDDLLSEINCLIKRLKRLQMFDKIPQFEALKQKLRIMCLEHAALLMERRIQMHFKGLSNPVAEDIVTLISSAQTIVRDLKSANLMCYADKLESYIDVLMFGKKAVQNSIEDAKKLISSPVISIPTMKFNCDSVSSCKKTKL